MILDYILPNRVYSSLKKSITELRYKSKYKSIVMELFNSGKLDELGIKLNKGGEMYLGINLNPELLLYSDTSQESVELKFINEKMKKYTDFFTVEGILDYMKVDYDRVRNDNHYGYIIQLSFRNVNYKVKRFVYDITYFSTIFLVIISSLFLIF